jgi:beta-glucosidase
MNRQFLDPVFRGRYPKELRAIFGEAWPTPEPDLSGIAERIDFLGVNYYTRGVMRHDPESLPERASRVRQRGRLHTETGWEVYPEGLTEALLGVRRRYGSDIVFYITENGAAFRDPDPTGGLVRDSARVRYLREHLLAARRAIKAGVDLRGYFVWSLLDNFEWSHGFSKRFGIVHVDFRTQKRTPKASARFYAEVIRTNGASLDVSARTALPPAPSSRRARSRKTRPLSGRR